MGKELHMNRQQPNISKYLAALSITALIFILGILLGSYFNGLKLNKLDNMENQLRVGTMSTELQFLILAEDPCSSFNSSSLTEQLYELSEKLDYMENELGVDDERVVYLKEYYSLLELRHWLLLKKAKEECDNDFTYIIYFYSNLGDCPKCDQQGQVLTYLRKKYLNVNIYSFDINIDTPALNAIKSLYLKKTQTPALIIDGNAYYGLKDREELEKIIFRPKEE
jgi:thiol-disulfide isomerase/thioredoxin